MDRLSLAMGIDQAGSAHWSHCACDGGAFQVWVAVPIEASKTQTMAG